MSHKIRISMLGTLHVVRDEHLVTESDWHTRQARQLLKILATERPRPVSTDRLIEILWPDSSPNAAATTLRSAINSLRNVLEPDRANRAPSQYILTQMPGYAFYLHPDIWLDVDHFERTLQQAQQTPDPAKRRQLLEEAITLYRDDYLISDPYADWLESERDRLRERYFTALLQLAELQAKDGDYASAMSLCRKILARDEVRENAWQSLMRYLAESGDSAGALLAYEKCRTILADELGADPSPLTQTLHQRILNGEIAPRSPLPAAISSLIAPAVAPVLPVATSLPQESLFPALDSTFLEIFVGRETEAGQLTHVLEQALIGKGGVFVLEGEAGVGKTRLAYHLLQEAVAKGATVISAASQLLERQLPFALLSDAIGRYLHALPTEALRLLPSASLTQLAQIIPSLADQLPDLPVATSDTGVGGAGFTLANEHRQRLVDGIVNLLVTLTQYRPLLLFLDDLHWADADSLSVLGRLSQRLSTIPCLLLLAYRSDELADNESLGVLLRALKRTYPQRQLIIQRLTSSQVQAYVDQVMGVRTAPTDASDATAVKQLASTIYETTQGNALFVTEALRDWQEQRAGDQALSIESWQLLTARRRSRIHEVVEDRISRLPEAAYSVLQLSAVIGRDFSLELLENAFPGDSLSGLEVLLQRNFLVERPDQRLDFSHQLVRQAAYDGMSGLQRRRWHLRVADGLVKLGRDTRNAAEVAFHYSRAGDSSRLSFAKYSVQAGESLLRSYGFRQAIDAFDQALATLEALPNQSPDLVQRALAGRGRAYENLFDPEGVKESYRRLLAWATQQGDPLLLITTYTRLTSLLALFGQQQESIEPLRQLMVSLTQTNALYVTQAGVIYDLLTRRQAIYTLNDLSDPIYDPLWTPYTPPPPAAADPAGELLQLLEPFHAVLPLLDYGWLLLVQGQLGEATRCLEAVIELANQTAQPSIASTAYHQLAVTVRVLGDVEQSQHLNERSVTLNRAIGGVAAELASMWPRIGSALLAIDTNRLEEAERRLRRVLDFLGEQTSYRSYRNSANIGLGLIALKQEDHPSARSLLEEAVADVGNFYPYTYQRALLGLAELHHKEGDVAQRDRYLQRALRFAGRRSLLEEYTAAVVMTAHLQPVDAPLDSLVQSVLRYVQSIGLESAVKVLGSI